VFDHSERNTNHIPKKLQYAKSQMI